MQYQGKKVLKINKDHHLYRHYTTRIEIVLEDYTTIEVSTKGNGLELYFGHTDPPKPKPWIANEKKMLESLSDKDKEKYQGVRKAFFWLIENRVKLKDHYKDKKGKHTFGVEVDYDENDPTNILTIFLSSYVAPECDGYIRLGRKDDWKNILETYEEVKG